MRAECIQAVVNAIGRSITQAEVKGIENRINQHHKRLAQDTLAGWQCPKPIACVKRQNQRQTR